MNHKFISIKGARLHNLKNIDVDIPQNRITVITGVSGSGKSTLAFDTLYAEGQRRFVESLSSYTRQFLERMAKPDVDMISGLPPAIAIEQKPLSKNPRSTVGTTTEVYDYLRLIFGRIGHTFCKQCGKEVTKDTPDSSLKEILKWNEKDKLYILFQISEHVKDLKEEIGRLKESGFNRIVLKDSDEIINLDEFKVTKKTNIEDYFVLADRLVLRNDEDTTSRIIDSLETAYRFGTGRCTVRNISNGESKSFSSYYECADCQIIYVEPEPRLFSFNNPYGACHVCQGFGRTAGIDEELVIPDKNITLQKNPIHPFRTQTFLPWYRMMLEEAVKQNIPISIPYYQLTDEQKEFIWKGNDNYPGIYGYFQMLEDKSYKMQYRIMAAKYRGYTTCKACGGSRIRTSARQVFINGKNIPELIKMPLADVLKFFEDLELDQYQSTVAAQVRQEIINRLRLLVDIGLHYLSLDRLSHSLSGGEAQRINLATALGSSLVGTLYVLDEPSIGLHSRDTEKLILTLERLRNLGNTIVVVEHDPDIMKHADNIIDIGPKAGDNGGNVVFSGTYSEILKTAKSLTGQYLSGKKMIHIPTKRRKIGSEKLVMIEPRQNNLRMKKVEFPLNCITVVTGVSGSGKSTLVNDILYGALKRLKSGYDGFVGSYKGLTGEEYIYDVELVDQSPIGKSARSTPVTYTKAFDSIRETFADTQIAKQLGLKPGYFSFNIPGGRCDKCEGDGVVTVDMQFLPDVVLECEACGGTRYSREARSILYNGKSIVDVLNMSVDTAIEFFEEKPKIVKKLKILQNVGLGYIKLGQPSSMLSGGEAQRIKLASHLETDSENNILFIFDEPTTGLHLDDIAKLLQCFNSLVDKGNSVLIIEHNLSVIAAADWVIDLGPEAGRDGGLVIAEGRPEDIAEEQNSFTGIALEKFFAERKAKS